MAENKTISDYEKDILAFWKKEHIFEKSLEQTKNNKPYIFYDGPPFATGLPHHGHLLASTLKDVFPRFFTMKGHFVKRVWGWDCHGLPIENIVEKNLKLKGKDEIEKIGVKAFNDACRSQVLTFVKEWEHYIDRIGRWVDFENGYKTMDTSYIESVWWAFQQLYNKGYLYEGEKVLLYCPRCSTPLAKSEIAMDNSYKKVKAISLVVKLALKGIKGKDSVYALAWTTTPWTLPSNLALAVHPEITYVYVKDKKDKNTYLLAKDVLSSFYKSENEYTVEQEVKGKELENIAYEPLFDYFKDAQHAFRILLGDFVTASEGTGIVHIAPAFGEEDNQLCRKHNISMVQPVDERGNFTSEVGNYYGMFVHDANEKIVIDLKKLGKAIRSQKIEHEYPFCYRCDTKLMYRALPAWFINIQKVKTRLLELNLSINWIPHFLRGGRMQHNIEHAPDWNITRNRYWATAIPLWKSEEGDIKVLGSVEELKKYAKNLPQGEIDLHKDYLDKVELDINGKIYKRIPEVLDCWFESGSMPFAQFHYPFENKEFFEKNFPAQFVVEYIAQTRTWFYYMMAISAILFDKIPFENVLTTGNLLAEDGSKLSKSKRNFTDPLDLIEKFGADTFRFYLLQSPVAMAEDTNISDKIIEEMYRKVTLLLYNTINFFEIYQNIEGSDSLSDNILDKWVMSQANTLILEVNNSLEGYNTLKACNAVRNFIDDLSTWYVRRSRERFAEGNAQAKATLKQVLDILSKVIAPLMPFVAEYMYQKIHGQKESVHLQPWPKENKDLISLALFSSMEKARNLVSLGLRQRDQKSMGVKWTLASATITTHKKLPKDFEEIIKDELNVKAIVWNLEGEDSVELDLKITPELEAEGYAREITRKIQSLRKEAHLVKEDKISLLLDTEFNESLNFYKEEIAQKVGAGEIIFKKNNRDYKFFKSGNIKGKRYTIKINKF